MAFGKEIKRLRDDMNLSAQKLADLIGIKADRLRKWEELDLNPRDEDVEKIESFFKMSINEIVKLTSIKKFIRADHPIQIEKELNSLLSHHEERLIRIEAALQVLGEKFAEIKYDSTGATISETLSELENSIKARYRMRVDELRSKQ